MTTPEMLKNLIKSLDDVSSTLTQFLESWKEKDYQRTLDLAELSFGPHRQHPRKGGNDSYVRQGRSGYRLIQGAN